MKHAFDWLIFMYSLALVFFGAFFVLLAISTTLTDLVILSLVLGGVALIGIGIYYFFRSNR